MGKDSDTWLDGVVLRATPALVFNVELPHLSIGNLLSFLIGAIQQSGPYHQPDTRGRATNTWLVLEVCVDEAKTVIDHDFFIVLTVLLNIVSGPIGNAIELPQEVKHFALNQQALEKVRNICTTPRRVMLDIYGQSK